MVSSIRAAQQNLHTWHLFHLGINISVDLCVFDLQLEETVHILRKRIEPEALVTSSPDPPSSSLPDPTPMEEDGVSLTSPTSGVPPPPLPEAQNEVEQGDQQQEQGEQLQEEHQEDPQEEQQPPPPPSGSEELLTHTEPSQDSITGERMFFAIKLTYYNFRTVII